MTRKYLIITITTLVFFAVAIIFIRVWRSHGTIIINRTEQINLNEGVNFIELNKQAGNFTVSILTKDGKTFLSNGIIVTGDGLILTARAELTNQKNVVVVLNDGRRFPVVIQPQDSKSDLAFFNVPAKGLTVAQFDDAGNLQAGQRIAAVGRSKKPFANKFMPGFVTNSSEDFQTDLRLDPDMTGGPLINLSGHVMALVYSPNKLILSETLQKTLDDYLHILQNNK